MIRLSLGLALACLRQHLYARILNIRTKTVLRIKRQLTAFLRECRWQLLPPPAKGLTTFSATWPRLTPLPPRFSKKQHSICQSIYVFHFWIARGRSVARTRARFTNSPPRLWQTNIIASFDEALTAYSSPAECPHGHECLGSQLRAQPITSHTRRAEPLLQVAILVQCRPPRKPYWSAPMSADHDS